MNEANSKTDNLPESQENALAGFALRSRDSKGRRYKEMPHGYRSLYQRDRDRIVHSTAFRRLMHKTQVLVTHTNDHHRTRLTHTLEVAQISRTIARQLRLNEDLAEAIALAHDLGHPPFGHAGEDTLDLCMAKHGGFEHNLHGLRIVEELEYRYPSFPGLNLTYEVLQAQALHSKRRDAEAVAKYAADGQPFLEAQVVDAADSLAYDTHDIDDALDVGLISLADLQEVRFWQLALERVYRAHPKIGALQIQPTVVRALIDWQVGDLLEHTRRQLADWQIHTVADVRACATLIVQPGPEVRALKADLEQFLAGQVYRHAQVKRMAEKGRRILTELFNAFCRDPELLPRRYHERCLQLGVERSVCDYVAGMTDRYAQLEYLRLFQPDSHV